MSSPTLRKLIMDDVKARLNSRYGPAGSVGKWFRECGEHGAPPHDHRVAPAR